MHWTAIIEGVATALVILILAGSRNHIRNWFLRRKIRGELSKATLGNGVLGLTATVRNKSQVELLVRDVFLRTPNAEYKFNPLGEESNSGRYAELFGHPNPNPPVADPFPRVPPLTGYTYRLPAEFIADIEGPALGLSITVEYDSYTGRRKVVQVDSNEWASELIRRTLGFCKKEYQSGVLNARRANFQLRPIPPGESADVDLSKTSYGQSLQDEGIIEKLSGSPMTAAATTVGAGALGAFFPPLAIVSPALAWVLRAPAGIRFKKRVETGFADIDERFLRNEKAVQNLTDGQFEFVFFTLNTLLQTADQRKIELLKIAIKNGFQEPFEHYEAKLVSRILRDISFEEARFLIEWIKFGRIEVMDGEGKGRIKHDSKERLIVAGLASIGVLMQSDTIGLDVNSYQFSAIAPKVAKLLTE